MDQLTQNWLFTLCSLIQGVKRAVVFLNASEKDGYTPTAFWPESQTDYHDFVAPAKNALSKGKCILLHNKDTETYAGEPFDVIACPLLLDEQLYGVVALQMSSRVPTMQQSAIQQVEGAAVWFEAMLGPCCPAVWPGIFLSE